MKKKPAGGEFVKGLLERFSAGEENEGSFHTLMFRAAYEGIKGRFRELSEIK
ncbi:MAG: hypothetical protein Sv326_0599 [Candidatus Fermentimicrarchaeum limneticum]|uniref:Uncharacterized protein n=1 Tax=Fermentimicrarchaeum limneticum TaxID=2795018 RepID=A0A7D5XI11_FERL1|nr:MAG: hypothetical protein Sv326_0599 [Candidatus Fermentimicrarchaeum limneticum]